MNQENPYQAPGSMGLPPMPMVLNRSVWDWLVFIYSLILLSGTWVYAKSLWMNGGLDAEGIPALLLKCWRPILLAVAGTLFLFRRKEAAAGYALYLVGGIAYALPNTSMPSILDFGVVTGILVRILRQDSQGRLDGGWNLQRPWTAWILARPTVVWIASTMTNTMAFFIVLQMLLGRRSILVGGISEMEPLQAGAVWISIALSCAGGAFLLALRRESVAFFLLAILPLCVLLAYPHDNLLRLDLLRQTAMFCLAFFLARKGFLHRDQESVSSESVDPPPGLPDND